MPSARSPLFALVPQPQAHVLIYHGVLAPASGWRDAIVPGTYTRALGGRPCAPA